MIRIPIDLDTSHVVTTTYAHVAAVARLPYVRYRERDGYAYAVRFVPALQAAIVYSAPIPGDAA